VSLSQKAFHAFKWSVLGEIASRAIGPLVFLILARLLVPEDFGVVAAAMVIISFSQVFSDAGLAKALIQRQDSTNESANVVFWLNLGIGLFLVAILVGTAPVIADFFHDQRIAPVVRVMSLQILLAAFSSVHTALLQKDLNFKQLFWVRLLTTGVPGLASIPLAINGGGYWALVVGTLFGQVVQSAILWNRSRWRPRLGMNLLLAGELIGFGKWAMLSGLLGWFYSWADAVVVGHYLGSHDMGIYRTSNTFVIMIYGVIFTPLLPVLYSAFSRINNNFDRQREVLLFVAKSISMISFPLAVVMWIGRDWLSITFLGPKWSGAGLSIGILAITHALTWVMGVNGELYRAIGKPKLDTYISLITIPIYVTGYLISIGHGMVVFLFARLILALISIAVHMYYSRMYLSIGIADWARSVFRSAIGAGAVLFVLNYASNKIINSPRDFFYVSIVTGFMYMVFMYLLDKKHFCYVRSLIQGSVLKGTGAIDVRQR
jgi:O-antigen/teichoic acid export membrane protein